MYKRNDSVTEEDSMLTSQLGFHKPYENPVSIVKKYFTYANIM